MSEDGGGGGRSEGGGLLFLLARWHTFLGYSTTVVQIGTALLLVGGIILFIWYRKAMHRRAAAVHHKLARGLVYRIKKTKQKKKQKKQTKNTEEAATADEETYLLGNHDDDDNDNENEDNDTDEETKVSRVVKVMELHPDFVNDAAAAGWQVCSLGHYLSSLRFFGGNTPTTAGSSDGSARTILERELYVVLAAVLLQTLGPTMGAAVLPLLGSSKAESMLGQTAQKLVTYIIAHVLVDHTNEENWDPLEDLACLPLNVMELISLVNLNQKLKETRVEISPLEWMHRGEVGYAPTYFTPPPSSATTTTTITTDDDLDSSSSTNTVLIPNPFIISEHFEAALNGLEKRIVDTMGDYDPDDRSTPAPSLINPMILPDLYAGWGDAHETHTKREKVRNRLFAVLLTKLSHNYHRYAPSPSGDDDTKDNNHDKNDDDEVFIVRMTTTTGGTGNSTTDCTYPDEFVTALLATGHTIEVCPRSAITTFGVAACLKEDDDTWTNIPIGLFFRTGYEQQHDHRPAFFYAPHGGMDMKIEGPLVGTDESGKSRKCDIQFYMAIEGMCGWHSNYNTDVPWVKGVSTTELYTTEQALTAIRMSGILACTFNAIGTELALPFGGYGVLGVCNDTAALVDFAVRGETNMYPLLSTGRYLLHTTTHLIAYRNKLREDKDMEHVANDTDRLVKAACAMDSDIHCSPKQLVGATRRYLANYPTPYFQIIEDSRKIMKDMCNTYKPFIDDENHCGDE